MSLKKILLIISSLLILATIPVAIYFVKQNQDIRTRAYTEQTTLTLQGKENVSVDESFNVNVYIDTHDNYAGGVEFEIYFDQTKLTTSKEKISVGSFFVGATEAAGSIVNDGYIRYGVLPALSAKYVQGTGIVASIEFTAIDSSATPTALEFGTQTIVYGGGNDDPEEPNNVLATKTNLYVTIQGDAPTNTPTPTVSPGPSATPTPTVDPNTTATPTPTVDPNATATPTVTPTPTGSINNTSTPTPTQSGTGGTNLGANLAITSPTANQSVSSSTPAIYGTSDPFSTITIVIHSGEPITAVVTADASGNWSYAPTTALSEGLHTITVTEETTGGETYSVSSSFYVGEGEVPITGIFETTLIMVMAAVILILFGIALI